VKKFSDRSKKTRSIAYRVKVKYPAAEVIEFYDAYFNGNGWRLSYEICQRQWQSFDDETVKGQPSVRQFEYSWEHPELKVQAFLWLRYEKLNKKWQDDVIVTCKLQSKDNT
jgi:hypothetical protein